MAEVNKPIYRLKPRSGLAVQYAAIRALFLREFQTRFGHYRLGYIWAILEPGMLVFLKLVLFGGIMERAIPYMSYTLFLVNGVLPIRMFMRSSTQSLHAVSSNRGLLNYRPVMPVDAVIARISVEMTLYFGVYSLFMVGLLYFGEPISLSYLPNLFVCWFLLYIFTFGFALIMCSLGDFSKEVAKFVSSFFIIFYLMSGVMFSINNVPVQFHPYLLWNPLLHCLEFMRHAVSPEYPVTYVSFNYLLISTLVVLFTGLLIYKSRERIMLTSK